MYQPGSRRRPPPLDEPPRIRYSPPRGLPPAAFIPPGYRLRPRPNIPQMEQRAGAALGGLLPGGGGLPERRYVHGVGFVPGELLERLRPRQTGIGAAPAPAPEIEPFGGLPREPGVPGLVEPYGRGPRGRRALGPVEEAAAAVAAAKIDATPFGKSFNTGLRNFSIGTEVIKGVILWSADRQMKESGFDLALHTLNQFSLVTIRALNLLDTYGPNYVPDWMLLNRADGDRAAHDARIIRFEEFISLDPTKPLSWDNINWDRATGRVFQPYFEGNIPGRTTMDLLRQGQGATGMFTFAFDNEAEDAFIALASQPGVKVEDAIDLTANWGMELLAGFTLDPTDWILGPLFESFRLRAAAGKIIDELMTPGLAKGFAEIVEEPKSLTVVEWLTNTSKRSKHTLYGDHIGDALATFATRVQGRPAVSTMDRLLLEASEGGKGELLGLLGERHSALIRDMAIHFKGKKLNTTVDVLKSYGPFAGRSGELVAEIADSIQDPIRAAYYMHQAAQGQYAAELGYKIGPRGAISRSFDFVKGVLIENWLFPNPAYHFTNLGSNLDHAIVRGYLYNPFDFGIASKVADRLAPYEMVIPNSVKRGFVFEALGQAEPSILKTEQIPWPIGKPVAWRNFLESAFNVNPKWFGGSFLWRGNNWAAELLDKTNWSTVLQGGRWFGNSIEQTARISVFWQAFNSEVEGKLRPGLLQLARGMGDLPPGMVSGLGNPSFVSSVSDIDELAKPYLASRIPSVNLAEYPYDAVQPVQARVLGELSKEIGENQLKYSDNLADPAFGDVLKGLFEQARKSTSRIYDQFTQQVLASTRLPEEMLAESAIPGVNSILRHVTKGGTLKFDALATDTYILFSGVKAPKPSQVADIARQMRLLGVPGDLPVYLADSEGVEVTKTLEQLSGEFVEDIPIRGQFRKSLVDEFGYTPEYSEAIVVSNDLIGKAWADARGLGVEDFYERFFEPKPGFVPGGYALEQPSIDSPLYLKTWEKATASSAPAPKGAVPGKEWLGYFKRQGISDDEMKYTDLGEWLTDNSTKKLSRAEVQDFLSEHAPVVTEVRREVKSRSWSIAKYDPGDFPEGAPYMMYKIVDEDGKPITNIYLDLFEGYENAENANRYYIGGYREGRAYRSVHEAVESYLGHADIVPAEYMSYNIPEGSRDYFEITVGAGISKARKRLKERLPLAGVFGQQALLGQVGKWEIGHFAKTGRPRQENIVVHVRGHTRDTIHGEPALLGLEVQSDIHEAIQRELGDLAERLGYAPPGKGKSAINRLSPAEIGTVLGKRLSDEELTEVVELSERIEELDKYYENANAAAWNDPRLAVYSRAYVWGSLEAEELHRQIGQEMGVDLVGMFNEIRDLKTKLSSIFGKEFEVYEAPFSKAWPRLGLKRLLIEAAQKGQKYLALPNAEMLPIIQRWPAEGYEKEIAGLDKFVNQELRNELANLGDKYGVKLEKIDLGWIQSGEFASIPGQVWALPITDEMRASLIEGGLSLWQPGRGMTQFTDKGRAIITALNSPDKTTALHELAHPYLHILQPEAASVVESTYGLQPGQLKVLSEKWISKAATPDEISLYRRVAEKFSEGYTVHIAEGVAPTPALKGLFEKFHDWLQSLLASIKRAFGGSVPDQMKAVYDSLYTGVDVTPIGRPSAFRPVKVRSIKAVGYPQAFAHAVRAPFNANHNLIVAVLKDGRLIWTNETDLFDVMYRSLGIGRGDVSAVATRLQDTSWVAHGDSRAIAEALDRAATDGATRFRVAGEFDGTLGEFLGRSQKSGLDSAIWDDAKIQNREELLAVVNEQRAQIDQQIDAFERSVNERLKGGIRYTEIVESQAAKVRAHVDKLKEFWRQGLEDASFYSAQEVDRILFNYYWKSNAEELLRNYTPFSTWQLRNPMFWAQTFIQRPGLVNLWNKYRIASEAERNQRNLTSRFQRTVPLPGQEFLQKHGFLRPGYYAYDPSGAYGPAAQFKQPFEPIGTQPPANDFERIAREIFKGQSWLGIRPWPWIGAAEEAVGLRPEGLQGDLFGPLQLLPYIGPALDKLQSALGLGPTEANASLEDYYVNRRLDEMLAERSITYEQARAAQFHPEDPTYQRAKEDVQSQLDTLRNIRAFEPFNIKYASPGEQLIRQEKALPYEQRRTGEFQQYQKFPELELYGRLFQTPEVREFDDKVYAINKRYDAMLGNYRPGSEEYRDLNRQRAVELAELYKSRPYEPGFPGNIPERQQPKEDSKISVLYRLEDMQPKPNDFFNEEGEVDWDAYDSAVKSFLKKVPKLSLGFGFQVDADEYDRFRQRYKSPEELAAEFHQRYISEGYDLSKALKTPSSPEFSKALFELVGEQFREDIQAGLSRVEAEARAGELVESLRSRGLPFEKRQELLAPYTGYKRAEDYRPEVERYRGGVQPGALEFAMPGMYGKQTPDEKARQDVLNFYYQSDPVVRRDVLKQLNLPDGVEFLDKVLSLSKEELSSISDWVQAQPAPGGDVSGLYKQLDRDFWKYNQPGSDKVWTPLMEQYYGSKDDPPGKFWDKYFSQIYNQDIFDDPVLSAIVSSDARDVFNYTDEQYEEALRYLQTTGSKYVNQALTKDWNTHTDWRDLAQQQQKDYRSQKDPALEELQRTYFAMDFSDQKDWQNDNPQSWNKLKAYVNTRRKLAHSLPYYSYFFRHDDYVEWYGDVPPGGPAVKQPKEFGATTGGGGGPPVFLSRALKDEWEANPSAGTRAVSEQEQYESSEDPAQSEAGAYYYSLSAPQRKDWRESNVESWQALLAYWEQRRNLRRSLSYYLYFFHNDEWHELYGSVKPWASLPGGVVPTTTVGPNEVPPLPPTLEPPPPPPPLPPTPGPNYAFLPPELRHA